MDQSQFNSVMTKLDSILKLLAMNQLQGKTLREKVELLSSLGFQPQQIADTLGKTPNHISVILHELRKAKKSGKEESGPAETSTSSMGGTDA